jgi:hypothetical protein
MRILKSGEIKATQQEIKKQGHIELDRWKIRI